MIMNKYKKKAKILTQMIKFDNNLMKFEVIIFDIAVKKKE